MTSLLINSTVSFQSYSYFDSVAFFFLNTSFSWLLGYLPDFPLTSYFTVLCWSAQRLSPWTSSLVYSPQLSNFIESPGFGCHLYIDESQIYKSIIHISLLNSITYISNILYISSLTCPTELMIYTTSQPTLPITSPSQLMPESSSYPLMTAVFF